MSAVAQPRRVENICGQNIVIFPDRDEITPEVQPLYDYWRDECGGAPPVPKTKIDPVAMPPQLLACMILIDALFDPPDFRYRLIGTEITRFVGRDSTGMLLSEIRYPEAVGDRIQQVYAAAAHGGEVVYVEDPADWASRDYVTMATLLLPASTDGQRTDLIVGAVKAVRRKVDPGG